MMNNVELRQTRERLGLSVKKMAEALQMSVRTYQGWESGRPIPPIGQTAVQLLTHLGTVGFELWMDHIEEGK